MWGENNRYGQLGFRPQDVASTMPFPMQDFRTPIRSVACGSGHTAAVTSTTKGTHISAVVGSCVLHLVPVFHDVV